MNFLTATVDIQVNDKTVKVKLDEIRREFSRTTDETQKSVKGLSNSFESAFRWGKYILVTSAFAKGLQYVTREAMQQENALFRLTAALKSTDSYSVQVMEDFQSFATAISSVTTHSNEEVMAIMQTASTLGIEANQLKLAAQWTIALSDALGVGTETASRYVAMALQGEYTMLRRYIPALKSAKNETEALTAISEFAARGFEISKAKAETTSGGLEQLKNAMSNVAASIGQNFLPQINMATKVLTENQQGIANWIKTASIITPLGAALEIKGMREAARNQAPKSSRFGEYYAGWLREQGKFDQARVVEERVATGKLKTAASATAQGQLDTAKNGAQEVLDMEAEMAKARAALVRRQQDEIQKTTIKGLDDQIKALDLVNSGQARTMQSAQEMIKIQEQLGVGTKATGDMWDLYRQKEAKVLSLERWREFSDGVKNSLTSAFDRLIFEGQKFGDFMKSLLAEVLRDMTRAQIIRPFSEMLGGGISSLGAGLMKGIGLTPAPVAHGGLTVGEYTSNKRTVPSYLFASARKYHGLKQNEQAIIAEKGEVVSRGEPSGSGTTNIYLNAIDTQSGVQFLMKHRRDLANLNRSTTKENHPNRRGG